MCETRTNLLCEHLRYVVIMLIVCASMPSSQKQAHKSDDNISAHNPANPLITDEFANPSVLQPLSAAAISD